MIFCAKKCAISGLCTSAHLHRQVEDADVSAINTPSRNCYFRVPASAFALASYGRQVVRSSS
jgi:hypothetical protein